VNHGSQSDGHLLHAAPEAADLIAAIQILLRHIAGNLAAGDLIHICYVTDKSDPLYVLDVTNPGAVAYLHQTYSTLREWGVRFIKMDFMDDTAAEGAYYRPNTTALEAQRIGLGIIREAVGEARQR